MQSLSVIDDIPVVARGTSFTTRSRIPLFEVFGDTKGPPPVPRRHCICLLASFFAAFFRHAYFSFNSFKVRGCLAVALNSSTTICHTRSQQIRLQIGKQKYNVTAKDVSSSFQSQFIRIKTVITHTFSFQVKESLFLHSIMLLCFSTKSIILCSSSFVKLAARMNFLPEAIF